MVSNIIKYKSNKGMRRPGFSTLQSTHSIDVKLSATCSADLAEAKIILMTCAAV